MEPKELAAKIVDILDSKKGIDIETIDLTGKTVLADYFVLASGNSTTQIKSLADEVEYVLKKDSCCIVSSCSILIGINIYIINVA